MNTSLPEMLHYLNTPENFNRNARGGGGAKMSVLERQQARVKWQQEEQLIQEQPPILPPLQQQLPMDYFQDFSHDQNLGGLLFAKAMKPDPNYGVTGLEMNYSVARTASCPPAVAAAISEVATKGKESVLPENLSSSAGRESFKKRKADKNQNSKVATEEESKDKKLKGSIEEKDAKLTEQKSTSKNTDNNNNNITEPSDTSKENSKVSVVQKPDYIHVRARRGQATDSHSLAERVRREKISERMKYLQDLVPGCNKITGRAGMLDEIINYVESLQRQVEFLSMKLAAVNPKLDFNIDNLIFPATTSEFHTIGATSEMTMPAIYPSDSLQQVVSCCGLEIGTETSEMALRRTMSALVSIPEALTVTESPCFNHIQPCNSTWDAELQNLYSMEFQQARSPLLPQPCTGFVGGSSVKMEM